MSEKIQTADFDFKRFQYIDTIEHTYVNVPSSGSVDSDQIAHGLDFIPVIIAYVECSWFTGVRIMPAFDYDFNSGDDAFVANGYFDVNVDSTTIYILMGIGNDGTTPTGDINIKLLIFRDRADTS